MNSLARMDTGLVIPKWSNSLVESLSTSRLVVKALVRRYILFNDSKRWSVLVAQRIPSTLVELDSSNVPSCCAAFISRLLLEVQALKLNLASRSIAHKIGGLPSLCHSL